MTDGGRQHGCPECAKRDQRIAELEERMQKLESELAKAKKNSRNSSKPPSGDIVTPNKKQQKRGRPKKRKRGGQPGHAAHLREPFTAEEIDDHWIGGCEACPCCGGALSDAKQSSATLQQVELPAVSVAIEQHDIHAQWCARCQKTFIPEFPEELRRAGLIGPRSTALVGFLKGVCHMSFSAIRKYFRDVIGARISRGMLRKLVSKVSDALAELYEALLAMLPDASRLNVGEMGHKENGQRMWTWCFRAYLYTVYKISPSRGSDVLVSVLGEEFDGILGCDYFSAYRKYMKDFGVLVQFCLAHFIRDVKFLVNHPNKKNEVATNPRLVGSPRASRSAASASRGAFHATTRQVTSVPTDCAAHTKRRARPQR